LPDNSSNKNGKFLLSLASCSGSILSNLLSNHLLVCKFLSKSYEGVFKLILIKINK